MTSTGWVSDLARRHTAALARVAQTFLLLPQARALDAEHLDDPGFVRVDEKVVVGHVGLHARTLPESIPRRGNDGNSTAHRRSGRMLYKSWVHPATSSTGAPWPWARSCTA